MHYTHDYLYYVPFMTFTFDTVLLFQSVIYVDLICFERNNWQTCWMFFMFYLLLSHDEDKKPLLLIVKHPQGGQHQRQHLDISTGNFTHLGRQLLHKK